MLETLENILAKRAKIEHTYGKALIDLANSSKHIVDTGTTKDAWEALKTGIERAGAAHTEASIDLERKLKMPVHDFREKRRVFRKRLEDDLKKAQKAKTSAWDKNQRLHKLYVSKCKEADMAAEGRDKMATGGASAREMDKMKSRADKAKLAEDAANIQYTAAVAELEEARSAWEKVMENVCTQYQRLEEERMEYQRDVMWVAVNMGSAVAVQEDQRAEEVRKSLEAINIKEDLSDFVRSKGTGSERPSAAVHVPYAGRAGVAAATVSTSSRPANVPTLTRTLPPQNGSFRKKVEAAPPANASLSAGRAPAPTRAPVPDTLSSAAAMRAGASASLRSNKSPPKPTAKARPLSAMLPPPSVPAATPATPAADANASVFYTAAYPYEAQGAQELTLKQGDRLKIIDKKHDEWWKANMNGRIGMVPSGFLKAVQ